MTRIYANKEKQINSRRFASFAVLFSGLLSEDDSFPLKPGVVSEIHEKTKFETCCAQVVPYLGPVRIIDLLHRFQFYDDLVEANQIGDICEG